jgi:integrase
VVVGGGIAADTGKRVKITRTFDTYGEAREFLNGMLDPEKKRGVMATGRASVAGWLKQWLEFIKPGEVARGTKPDEVATRTYEPYADHVERYLVPQLGGVLLRDLTPLCIEAAYARMQEGGVSAKMVRKAHATLRAALSMAVRKKALTSNPAKAVKPPKVEKDASTDLKVFDRDQLLQLLAAAQGDRFEALFVLWAVSGAREGELFALHWPEVDWEAKAVTIIRSLEEDLKGNLRLKELKTLRSKRRVAVGERAINALADHRRRMLAEGRDVRSGLVFCDTQGGPLRKSNFYHRHWLKVLKRAGLPHRRPYDLRHTTASLLLQSGEDIKVVADRLGHASTVLTQNTYQHCLPGMQERAAAKLDVLLGGAQAGGGIEDSPAGAVSPTVVPRSPNEGACG